MVTLKSLIYRKRLWWSAILFVLLIAGGCRTDAASGDPAAVLEMDNNSGVDL